MPVFSYFNKLSPAEKRLYRRSDGILRVDVPRAEGLQPLIPRLTVALASEDRAQVEKLCRSLAAGMVDRLDIPLVRVKVLAVRPSADWGELHGLYEPAEGRAAAVITLWMRTAKQKRVVAFKSFVRTLLHEFCHHLDYQLFGLSDSFHTEGFYKRESSLFHQLVPEQEKEKPVSKS